MPTPRTPASERKLVPAAAESSRTAGARRVRLSRAVAAKPTAPSAGAAPSKSNGQKQKKPKLVSSRYKILDSEHAQLAALKSRLQLAGTPVRKSELMRAGLMLLVALDDVQLRKAVDKVAVIKLRRPAAKAD